MSLTSVESTPSTWSSHPVVSLAELMSDLQGHEPIRDEIFGQERLDAFARGLAIACTLQRPKRRNSPLLRRFDENAQTLIKAHARIVSDQAPRGDGRGLDAEWLADNYHIVEDVLREIRQDLPKGYDRDLPKLGMGAGEGYPRIYAMALALVAHTDSELDEARITRFVQSFQSEATLTTGELWALPTMLRLVLVENLRRLATKMLWGWDERTRAEQWVAQCASDDSKRHAPGLEGSNPSEPPPPANPTPLEELSDPYLVRLLQLLRDRGSAIELLERLEKQSEQQGTDVNEVLRREHRRQAANQISVGNCVISLRLLSALDWNSFFESVSAVEAILQTDPSGVHLLQDFQTRDRYRRAVEKISRGSSADECDVARRCVQLAAEARAAGADPRQAHIGYYLIGPGKAALQRAFRCRLEWPERIQGWMINHPRLTYFGSLLFVFLGLVTLILGTGLGFTGTIGLPMLALAALLVALPVSELAVGLVNHLLTLVLPPRVLPKLEFKEGISADCLTFVVMPSMLVRPDSAEKLLEQLEIHYLANPDEQLRFALLTDFADAHEETRPEDEGYLRDALARVESLNQRYPGKDGTDRFFLFHRRRLWNPHQDRWMGWERKRGKLSEFNHLLLGHDQTSYAWMSHDPSALPATRFVITLDADTQLPRDSARRLIGTLAHPLNQPRFDPELRRVVEGYGILQPRVSFHLTAATHSRFAAILAASGGIDPYSSASSDTYMDLFGVGSFTGKGIYDVKAFEASTGQTFPENQILSHDLVEGNYARCGLATDTELFDDFPARYHAYARREHRWIRGDWQLFPWLGFRVPTAKQPLPNPLPALERWKLFDNLRRSLVAPALVVMLALGWTILPGSPWLWTAVAIAVPMLPLAQILIGALYYAARSRNVASLLGLRAQLPAAAIQALMSLTFKADQAYHAIDAVTRTLIRHYITRKNLLEWETAASADRRLGQGLVSFISNMWSASGLAVGLAILVALVRPSALIPASPVLLTWFLSPLVAYWVSQPRPRTDLPLHEGECEELRGVARRTWYFFETFVGDEDHWLPPDNFQEIPDGRIAHRTSPTNQGLLLLSTLAAHDLGYIGLGTLADRLEKSLDTFDVMEKHWGHFYNWYDTRTLRPLPPAYISTVDSGNLLGCLVALKQGLREKSERPFLVPHLERGLADTLELTVKALDPIHHVAEGLSPANLSAVDETLRRLDALLASSPTNLLERQVWLEEVEDEGVVLVDRIQALVDALPAGASLATMPSIGGPNPDVPHRLITLWPAKFVEQVHEFQAELGSIAPWLPTLIELERSGGPEWSSPERKAQWASIRARLVAPSSLASLSEQRESLAREIRSLATDSLGPEGLGLLADQINETRAPKLGDRLQTLAGRAESLAQLMDFRPLYKPERHLYSIGCNLVVGRLDNACYDLLASESSLTSFLTIARGDAPRRHWFQLGRPFLRTAGRVGLVSWGGTMFEYLMPRLLLRALPGTIVAEAARSAVARQIEYGREIGIPWGISESAFNAQYVDGDYQYQSFGVPGLGLKRGLDLDQVVAPYATALATMIVPREALENLRALEEIGALGVFGFYEAIDYTSERVPQGERFAVVRSYMAHHQGMSLVALANALLDEPMTRRFHSDPMVKAVDLLLQERVPRDAPVSEPSESTRVTNNGTREGGIPLLSRRLTTPNTPVPRTHLLSNSQYHVMVTNAGSGYSECRGLDVTRWRADPTLDAMGQVLYVKDKERGVFWSAGYQPVCKPAGEYEVVFAADKASFRRLDGEIETLLEVTVSPEQLAEVRRLTLRNLDNKPRELEVTSYVEVVLGSRTGDLAHPAFGKLFLETEYLPGSHALLCRRRPRSVDQQPIWAVHVVAADRDVIGEVEYETDRARFLGRGRLPQSPAALDREARLSGTTGSVLDPILSLRRTVRLAPGESTTLAFTTAVADSNADARSLADQYHDPSAAGRAFELAWAHSQVEHRHRNWSQDDAYQFQRLAAHILYPGSALRAPGPVLAANRQGQPGLWKYGISGDLPIILVQIAEAGELELARQALLAHAYLRHKGLRTDLVLLNEQPTSYFEEVNQQLLDLVRSSAEHDLMDVPGGIFICKAAVSTEEDKVLLQAAARVMLVGDRGPLASQLDRIERMPTPPAPFTATRAPRGPGDAELEALDLEFDNGFGGFGLEGREYCVVVRSEPLAPLTPNGWLQSRAGYAPLLPPAPWINVISNPFIGCLVSEAGAGYTWAGNSQTNRLTPWRNDPVSDAPGEALYVRDEETGEYWSPTPLPVVTATPTLVRHGQGYTLFERKTHGLEHELLVLVAPDDPVKLIRLRVRNNGQESRSLSATFYAEWVLGTTREATSTHLITEIDPETGTLLARNAFRTDFNAKVAFVDVNIRPREFTTDRQEFLGRNGSISAPAALGRVELSGRAGLTIDPCAAIQTRFTLEPGAETSIVFMLGEADSIEAVQKVVSRVRGPVNPDAILEEVRARWDNVLSTVEIRTPDRAFDLLLNRWLVYQVLSCRLWGRSALYQSGGAYGFRDQLQDSMALVYGAPEEARKQLLRAASRQFVEGDVQHWWHPPAGQGVRTRFSDDLHWLAFVAAHYVRTTGDASVLDEVIPFLKGPLLKPDQEEDYGIPSLSSESGTLYDHCLRALSRGMQLGAHGLPLMGTGDWNDGMNRVGSEGKGESVWVAWFLITIYGKFAEIAESRGDHAEAKQCVERAETLRRAVEKEAWDGEWYRRAYFDDGTPLGSAQNDECQIDSIAQTWAVISGVADPARAEQAMLEVNRRLVRPQDGVILLFTPPFDQGSLEPGYIKGYVPGIRENGGQYTHAAIWVALATALQGKGQSAFDLFSLLNPINHTLNTTEVERYKVEPYVVAADVYGQPPHTGRGGWTWYTGSASWLYRVGLESILGFHLQGDQLRIDPCIPSGWPRFELDYRRGSTRYRIVVENQDQVEKGVVRVKLDGRELPDHQIPLVNDGGLHEVEVRMGTTPTSD